MNNENKPVIAVVFHSSNLQSGATRSLMDIINNLIRLEKYQIIGVFPQKTGTAIEHLKNNYGLETYFYNYGTLMQDLTQSNLKRIIKLPLLFIRHMRIITEAFRASQELRNKKIDCVYSNTSSIVFGGYVGKFLKCKQLWHIREFRIKDHKIKFYLGERWIKKFINSCAEKVLYVSEAVMRENLDVIPKNKSYVTYNSYDKSFIDPKNKFNQRGPLKILLAGDIKESKGQLITTKAVYTFMEKNPNCNVELYLAGRESNKKYYTNLKNYIIEHDLESNIHLLGQVSNMKELRAKMDVGIVASTCEAFGRTTIEGMLSMLAMIGRSSGGTTEQIRHGETGLLYDGSVDDLVKCISELYFDRKMLAGIAKAGFEEAVNLHTKGNCYKIVESVIDEVLSSK